MKRKLFFTMLAGTSLALALPISTAAAATFQDMPSDYSTIALEAAVENGLLSGADGLISPNANLTRAEMATILVRAFGAETESTETFYDVKSSDWFADKIAKAVYMGAFSGDGGAMRPNDPITRQEVAVVLAAVFELESGNTSTLSQFDDESSISNWAKNSVAALVEHEYMSGTGTGLSPSSNILRKDFAVIMNKIVGDHVQRAGEYTFTTSGSVMISTAGVTLVDMKIPGDLILGDGIAEGDVILKNVAVGGSTIVRGGGPNSIYVTGDSTLPEVLVVKQEGNVRLVTDSDASVGTLSLQSAKGTLAVEGNVREISLETAVPVSFQNLYSEKITATQKATSITFEGTSRIEEIACSEDQFSVKIGGSVIVDQLACGGNNSTLLLEEDSIVKALYTTGEEVEIHLEEDTFVGDLVTRGSKTEITVADGGIIETAELLGQQTMLSLREGAEVDYLTLSGKNSLVSGSGYVYSIEVGADDVVITLDVTDTIIEIAETAEGTIVNEEEIEAGTTINPPDEEEEDEDEEDEDEEEVEDNEALVEAFDAIESFKFTYNYTVGKTSTTQLDIVQEIKDELEETYVDYTFVVNSSITSSGLYFSIEEEDSEFELTKKSGIIPLENIIVKRNYGVFADSDYYNGEELATVVADVSYYVTADTGFQMPGTIFPESIIIKIGDSTLAASKYKYTASTGKAIIYSGTTVKDKITVYSSDEAVIETFDVTVAQTSGVDPVASEKVTVTVVNGKTIEAVSVSYVLDDDYEIESVSVSGTTYKATASDGKVTIPAGTSVTGDLVVTITATDGSEDDTDNDTNTDGDASTPDSEDDDKEDSTTSPDSEDDDKDDSTTSPDSEDDDKDDSTTTPDSEDDDKEDSTTAPDSEDDDKEDSTTSPESEDEDKEDSTTTPDPEVDLELKD